MVARVRQRECSETSLAGNGREFSIFAVTLSLINPFFEELIVRAYMMTEIRALTGSAAGGCGEHDAAGFLPSLLRMVDGLGDGCAVPGTFALFCAMAPSAAAGGDPRNTRRHGDVEHVALMEPFDETEKDGVR